MKFCLGLLLLAGNAVADEREIQRALIQRDQQSAEFSNRRLENLHSDQLRDAGRLPPAYERQRMAQERDLVPAGAEQKRSVPGTDLKPLPLPGSGGPPHVVIPISTPSIGG
jgi:hypothetical protein